jgi:hypothetical protein
MWSVRTQTTVRLLGKEARKVAIERFDIEKIAGEYERVLKSVFANQS